MSIGAMAQHKCRAEKFTLQGEWWPVGSTCHQKTCGLYTLCQKAIGKLTVTFRPVPLTLTSTRSFQAWDKISLPFTMSSSTSGKLIRHLSKGAVSVDSALPRESRKRNVNP